MEEISNSWNGLYEYRKKIRKQFPLFWKIKVIKKHYDVIKPYLSEGISVLDVGSGNRHLGDRLKEENPKILFKSMDIDRKQHHDYYSLEEINEKFDIISLFEVIEHLEFTEGVEMFKKLEKLLLHNGRLVLTTPNVFHPNRYWEYSHKVSYRYDEICGLLLALGYKVTNVYRIYNDSFLKRLIRLYIMAPVHRYFNIDFARSIAIVAQKT